MTVPIARRKFVVALAGAAAWPLAARAQQGERIRRIGALGGGENDSEGKPRLSAFMQALAGLGWTEGRNVRMAFVRAAVTPIGYGRSRRNWSACNRTSRWQSRPRRPLPSSGRRGRSRSSRSWATPSPAASADGRLAADAYCEATKAICSAVLNSEKTARHRVFLLLDCRSLPRILRSTPLHAKRRNRTQALWLQLWPNKRQPTE